MEAAIMIAISTIIISFWLMRIAYNLKRIADKIKGNQQ